MIDCNMINRHPIDHIHISHLNKFLNDTLRESRNRKNNEELELNCDIGTSDNSESE